MSQAHIQPLFDGPLDIVGDIHGEIGALDDLLVRLGYDRSGRHRQGQRRLVFVGDVVDRGEDSPAVVERIMEMVLAGHAQCVLGNHELNLVLGERKEGNGWFWPNTNHDHERGHFLDAPGAGAEQRLRFLEWFATLPLALEREDLRVVHACWDDAAIETLRSDTRTLTEIHEDWSQRVQASLGSDGLFTQREAELHEWSNKLHDLHTPVPMLPALAAIDARQQSAHPLKVLTSGIEQPTAAPFFGGGKWRMTERVAWWDRYQDEPAVVFGHYWRWAGDEDDAVARSRGPNLFAGYAPEAWLGPRRNVMCIDYCAGLRWRERAAGITNHNGLLAAVRWPERSLATSPTWLPPVRNADDEQLIICRGRRDG